jgi:hypothetical protein
MDPLTISTAIAGFLSLATPFAKVLKDYIGDAKAAPKEARDLLIQVNLLSQVLQQFTQFLVHEGTQGQWFDLTAVLSSVIRLCQQQIERLHQKLSKAVATNPFWKMIRGRLKWPFETDECRKTIQSLHHCMQAFEFSLSIQNRS